MQHKTLRSYFSISKQQVRYITMLLIIWSIALYTVAYLFSFFIESLESKVTIDSSVESAVRFLVYFLPFFFVLSYLYNCFICRAWIIPNFRRLVMYMGLMLACAVSFEILFDQLFVVLLSRPSWVYQILPVHNGHTSGVMIFLWPWYGFHYYLLIKGAEIKKAKYLDSIYARSFMTTIDAMTIEVLVNVFTLTVFGSYIFRYIPGDLFHLTSIEIFIPYYISGFITVIVSYYIDKKTNPLIWMGIIGYIVGVFIVWGLG